jgi:hypothetical protein
MLNVSFRAAEAKHGMLRLLRNDRKYEPTLSGRLKIKFTSKGRLCQEVNSGKLKKTDGRGLLQQGCL